MKTKSCKAKARKLQNEVASLLNERFNTEDFRPAIMGEKGTDIKHPVGLSFPWAVECKNCQAWNVPAFWRQTVANSSASHKPLLVIGKNRHESLVVLRLADWLDLVKSKQIGEGDVV